MTPGARATLLALAAAGAAFAAVCRVEPHLNATGAVAETDALQRLLGSARAVIADDLYRRADLYFHRGVGAVESTAAPLTIFRRAHDALTPRTHEHLGGRQTVEILPWLQLAAAADPANVEIWLTAAYWVERDGRRPDLARAVYRVAARWHPRNLDIHENWARFELRQGRLEDALGRLRSVWRRAQTPAAENGELFTPARRAALAVTLGLTEIALGNESEGRAALRAAREIQPALHGWVEAAESGALTPAAARRHLAAVLQRALAAQAPACEHDHETRRQPASLKLRAERPK